jgi:hypothetical protein
MPSHFRLAKTAWSFLSLVGVLSAAILAGCDSAPPDPSSPEAQKAREQLSATVAKQEEQANKNSKGVVLKSIKRLNAQPQPAK